MTNSVRKYSKDREEDREKDCVDYALAQLKVEQNVRFLVEELANARGEISYFKVEVSSLRVQPERLERERKNLMEILILGGYLHRRNRAHTDSTGGHVPLRRRMCTHPTWQLYRVCVALSAQHERGR